MSLDMESVRAQLETKIKIIAQLQASQYQNICSACKRPVKPEDETWDDQGNWYHMDCLTLCAGCEKPIPPQDIRCQDSEGHDVCLAYGDGVKPDMEATG